MTEIPLHHPSVLPTGEGELYCFMDKDRPCSADCMAYLGPLDRPDSVEYQGKSWPSCLLLLNAHRTGKHLTVLASIGGEMNKSAKTQAADEQRRKQPPPPSVK